MIPDAKVTTTYAGDQDDAAKAKEAVQAQIDQGVGAVYPYLGGSTDAATKLANTKNLITLTPGTDRCASTDPKFDISVLFSPGDYFTEALKLFDRRQARNGRAEGVDDRQDPYPTVKLCGDNAEAKKKIDTFMQDIASGKIDAAGEVERLGN